MGSATDQARVSVVAALDATPSIELGVARDLFTAARTIGGSSALNNALADSSVVPAVRVQVVDSVFGTALRPESVALLRAVVQQRWSDAGALVEGVEELAIRAAAIAASADDIEGQLFGFSRAIARNPELELALGSRLRDSAAKGALVDTLLQGRVSEAAVLIARSLVQQPRERRVRQLIAHAMRLVADQRGRTVATVYTAAPLTDAQAQRLSAALSARYGTGVALNTVIDRSVVGGLRVQIADDVIDASVSSRLADLRQRLAG